MTHLIVSNKIQTALQKGIILVPLFIFALLIVNDWTSTTVGLQVAY
jgi:hypothetical protein